MANLILSNLEKAGQNGRKVYQRRLPSDTSKDYYFIHRNTGVTQPVIVEYGFLDSTGDDVNQLKNNYAKYAQAVVDAVIEYIQDEPSGVYIVQNGDTLYSIARKFNTTVNAIKDLNNLTSNTLSVGQQLRIPESEDEQEEPEGEIYIVQSGDTLYSIARKFNTTVDEIKRLNNLTSNNLSIGQRLIIKEKANDMIEDQDVYIVQSGDTLYSIARKFNLTVDELKTMNNLTSNTLSIGQVLIIKPNQNGETQDILYTVKRGDSLYSIAREYDVSVDELMQYNELKTNLLSIDQTLRIPKPGNTTNENIYTVQSGDSLWSIAKKFGTTVNALKEENNLQSNLLSIGQKLRIP